MDPIYVTGHRNPDTDSIVAALSYTALRHALGDREYVASRLGPLSEETQLVLDRFGFAPPRLLTNVYTQVRDLRYDTPPILSAAVTIGRAWEEFLEHPNIAAIPVANEDGTLYGILSRVDIADYNMRLSTAGVVEAVPLFNLLSVLEGKAVNEACQNVDTISGEVTIALPQAYDNLLFQSRNSVVLCGHQPDMIRRALEMNVNALVLCQAQLPPELAEIPTSTCIITTPYDAYRAARLIFQSTPIGRICHTGTIVCFRLDEQLDDVRETVLKYRHPSYPILDENGKVVGVLTRYHLLRPHRKRVVLVDHNELRQSVPGLEEAEILEIVDHHRLADIQTAYPIYVRNEPVGSTNTIIAGMFQERGLMSSPGMAGMMAAAILSDTVMFKSPTCTERDIRTATRLARIANVSLEDLGKEIFSASVEGKTEEELLFRDFKEFQIAGHSLGVGQITCVDSAGLLERKEAFLSLMGENAKKKHYDLLILMITDVLQEGTWIFYVGDDEAITQAFSVEPRDNCLFLQKVLSRKKQVVPMLSALWG